MKAYPALVDSGSSVALRLLDSPQRAVQETRFALRRLFLLTAGREVQTQVDWLPGLDKAGPIAALIPGFDLRQQLADLLAAGAWPDEVELPRTKAAFEAALGAARQRIGLAVQDLAGVIGPWFEAYREARTALDAAGDTAAAAPKAAMASPGRKTGAKPTPTGASSRCLSAPQAVKWQYAIDDIRDQLARLAGPKCLSTTPWTWLRHCPRYFRAIRVRLDALAGGGMAKDRERYRRVPSPLAGLSRLGPAARAAVRSRCGVDPVSLDAGGVSRLALCPEAGNFDPRLGETPGAAVVASQEIKAEGGRVVAGLGPLLWPVSDRATLPTGGLPMKGETFGRAYRRGRETLAEPRGSGDPRRTKGRETLAEPRNK